MSQKLVVFSGAEVLVDTKSWVVDDILTILNKGKEINEIQKEWEKRKKFGPWGLEEITKLLKGFHRERLDRLTLDYCKKHLVTGAGETIAELKLNNCLVGMITTEVDFIIEALSKIFNFDFVFSNELEYKKGICTGKILGDIYRDDKARILKEIMRERKIPKKSVFVVGNKITDITIGKEAGIFIGFCPKNDIKDKFDVIIEEKDLEKIIPPIFN